MHFENAARNRKFQITALVEPVGTRRDEYVAREGCKGFETLTEALNDKTTQIDAVAICTPTGSHPELIRGTRFFLALFFQFLRSIKCSPLSESLNAGKQVFCEKPIAYDTKIVDDLYDLAASKKLILLCGIENDSYFKLKRNIKICFRFPTPARCELRQSEAPCR